MIKFLLTHIQSLLDKQDMFLHYMELANMHIGFITDLYQQQNMS